MQELEKVKENMNAYIQEVETIIVTQQQETEIIQAEIK
jgi:hypothetical protein